MDIEVLSQLMTGSKTFKKWLKRVQDDKSPWSENEIIYFRKFLGNSSSATPEQKRLLHGEFKEEYTITPEQTTKGIEYIRNVCFKKNGELRQTQDMPFGQREANIIANFSEFRFVGLYDAGQNNWSHYLPVYRVIANDGSEFEYYAGSHGHMQVIG